MDCEEGRGQDSVLAQRKVAKPSWRASEEVLVMDLNLPHICMAEVFPNMVRIKTSGWDSPAGGGPRGEITGFSNESRKRMLEMMNCLQFERLTFVTLTYPAVFPADGHEVKEHLRRFRARLEKKFGKIRVVWRMEYQERGAPHFHLIIMDAPFICRWWLSKAWVDSNDTHSMLNFRFGSNIKGIAEKGDSQKVINYVCKYAGKVEEHARTAENEWCGRFWGKWNCEKPIPVRYQFDPGEALRIVAGALSARGSDSSWKPVNELACRIFGSGVGSDDYGRLISDSLEAFGATRCERELDN